MNASVPTLQAAAAMERIEVTCEGRRMSCLVGGSGPAVLLIAGFGMSGQSWLALRPDLLSRGIRWVVPDNWGTGESDLAPRARIAAYAAGVAEVVRGVGGVRAVVGHSLGGVIGQCMAVEYPDLVPSMVLMSTMGREPRGLGAFRMAKPRMWLPCLSASVDVWRLNDRWMLGAACWEADHDALGPLREMQRHEPYRRTGALQQVYALTIHRWAHLAGRVACPVLVVGGDEDRVIPVGESEALARSLPRAELTVLPGVGHFPPLERPERFFEAVRWAVDAG